MNQLHGRFRIANGDFLYVLSTFVFEPIRWNRRFGWRPMCEQERLGLFYFWREVGRRMGIKDLPADIDAFERFSHAYERERFRLTPANRRVGDATVNLFASWFPRPFSPMVRAGIYALLDDPVIEGFGFPRPALAVRWLVPALLQLRALVLGRFPTPRRPSLRTEGKHRSYPSGYIIEELGPPTDSACRVSEAVASARREQNLGESGVERSDDQHNSSTDLFGQRTEQSRPGD